MVKQLRKTLLKGGDCDYLWNVSKFSAHLNPDSCIKKEVMWMGRKLPKNGKVALHGTQILVFRESNSSYMIEKEEYLFK